MSANLYKSSDGNALRFYEEPVKNNHASDVAGAPVFDTRVMVEVIAPGSSESIPTFEIERKFSAEAIKLNGELAEPRRTQYHTRYKEQYDAYRANHSSEALNGVPLSEAPFLDAGQRETLIASKIYTVEALAEVPDSGLKGIGLTSRKVREQAKAFLASRNDGAETAALTAKADNLQTELDRVTKERDDALAQVKELTTKLAAASLQTTVDGGAALSKLNTI